MNEDGLLLPQRHHHPGSCVGSLPASRQAVASISQDSLLRPQHQQQPDSCAGSASANPAPASRQAVAPVGVDSKLAPQRLQGCASVTPGPASRHAVASMPGDSKLAPQRQHCPDSSPGIAPTDHAPARQAVAMAAAQPTARDSVLQDSLHAVLVKDKIDPARAEDFARLMAQQAANANSPDNAAASHRAAQFQP